MDTMLASTRRTLPPVPRPAPAHPAAAAPAGNGDDAAQQFVSSLRAAAPRLAAAAGAESAVVREAVPPARHRRSRCRLVLRYADGTEHDLTLLGPAGRPVADAHSRFEATIEGWLGAGQQRGECWIVPDADAPDRVAVDLTAWITRR